MMDSKIVEVYRAKDGIEAAMIVNALEDAGIRARVNGDLLQGISGAIQMGWTASSVVMVFDHDAAQASAVIRRLLKQ